MKECICITLFLMFTLYLTVSVIKEVSAVHDNIQKIVYEMNSYNKGE